MSLQQGASSLHQKLRSHLSSKVFYGVALVVVAATIASVAGEKVMQMTSPAEIAVMSRVSWVLLLVGVLLGGFALLPGQDHPTRKRVLGTIGFLCGLTARLLVPQPVLPPKDISGVKAAIVNTSGPAIGISSNDANTAHQILKSRPDPEQVAEGELALGMYPKAIDDLAPVEQALENHLADIHFYNARALWALANSDIALPNHKVFQKALEEANFSLSLRPTYSPALVIKCVALRDAGRIDEALAVCEDAIRADRGNEGAWTAKGGTLIAKGDKDLAHGRHYYEEALAALEVGISTHSTRELWADKALALESLGRNEEALKAIQQALKLSPEFTNALIAEGTILKRLNRLPEAIDIYRKIADSHPTDAEAWNNLGNALEDHGDFNDALIYFDKALGLKPDLKETLFDKGQVLNLQKRYGEAIVPLQEDCELDSQDAEARYELAFAFYKIGNGPKATSLIAEALKLSPHYPAPSELKRAIQLREENVALDTNPPPM